VTDLSPSPENLLPPYARVLGMVVDSIEPDGPVIAVDHSPLIGGRPGFQHGGAIGGLLEMAGFASLRAELARRGVDVRIKPVNISIEYVRGALPQRTFALGTVLRAGRRVANVRVEAWQADRNKPVAICWINFLLAPPKP